MSYTIYRPETATDAIALQAATGGSYLAGGTVTMVNRHRGQDMGQHLISLDRVGALKVLESVNDRLYIGAGLCMDELEHSPLLRAAPALWQAAREVGGPQIRNRATLGGNLASGSPAADCAVPLLAMGAELLVEGAEGQRTIPIREFFLGRMQTCLRPSELILCVIVPAHPENRSAFRKVGKRNALAVSCLSMSVFRDSDSVHVAVGACAPRPLYCPETSRLLTIGDEAGAFEALQSEICPIDDRWATASYRRTVCGNLLRALLEETL